MADSSQDRQLPATPRRLEKAREEGQVARSRDLGHFAAIGVTAGLIYSLAPLITERLTAAVAGGLRFDLSLLAGPRPMTERLVELSWSFAGFVIPFGIVMMLVALGSGVAGGGWLFSWQAVTPKFSKLDPWSGIQRMFSGQQVFQALKASALALVLGLIGAIFLRSAMPRFLHGAHVEMPAALTHAMGILWDGTVPLLLALGALALVDLPVQRGLWLRRLRMSHSEMKQEHKEMEGNAEVKGRMRARMREMANKRMLGAVPQADLVVMNPTHFAVALRYDEKTMSAPRVVAKGADLMALRIRDIAKDAKVPVLQAPPLARALYTHAEVDREIPAALFSAVAQVLAWVYQLKAASAGRGAAPADLPALHVPAELDPLNKRTTDA